MGTIFGSLAVLSAPVSVDVVLHQRFVSILLEANRRYGMSVEKMAVWLDVDVRQLRRQLEGEGNISFTRMMQLPVGWWGWFAIGILTEFGIPRELRRAARVSVAIFAEKRMAKMERSA